MRDSRPRRVTAARSPRRSTASCQPSGGGRIRAIRTECRVSRAGATTGRAVRETVRPDVRNRYRVLRVSSCFREITVLSRYRASIDRRAGQPLSRRTASGALPCLLSEYSSGTLRPRYDATATTTKGHGDNTQTTVTRVRVPRPRDPQLCKERTRRVRRELFFASYARAARGSVRGAREQTAINPYTFLRPPPPPRLGNAPDAVCARTRQKKKHLVVLSARPRDSRRGAGSSFAFRVRRRTDGLVGSSRKNVRVRRRDVRSRRFTVDADGWFSRGD